MGEHGELYKYFKGRGADLLIWFALATLLMSGKLVEVSTYIVNIICELLGSDSTSAETAVVKEFSSAFGGIITIILALIVILLTIKTQIDILYITCPFLRVYFDRNKLCNMDDIAIKESLASLCKQKGIEIGLLPNLYELQTTLGAEGSRIGTPFTFTGNMIVHCAEFEELAEKYNKTYYYESLKERDAGLRAMQEEISAKYNEVMCNKINELQSEEDIDTFKKVICEYGNSIDNELSHTDISINYDKCDNNATCTIEINPKSNTTKVRLCKLLEAKAKADGHIKIKNQLDAFQVVKYINNIKAQLTSEEEIQKVKDLIKQDVLGTFKPIEIEDNSITYNDKAKSIQ